MLFRIWFQRVVEYWPLIKQWYTEFARATNSKPSRFYSTTVTVQLESSRTQVRVFGWCLNNAAKGGNLDLLPKSVENLAVLTACMSAKMYGRKVGEFINAPNFKKLAIYETGHREGRLL